MIPPCRSFGSDLKHIPLPGVSNGFRYLATLCLGDIPKSGWNGGSVEKTRGQLLLNEHQWIA